MALVSRHLMTLLIKIMASFTTLLNRPVPTVQERQPRRFWCHYCGSDGNTPRRRSLELKPLEMAVSNYRPVNPFLSTPLWYIEEQGYDFVALYAQISDTVATKIDYVLPSNVQQALEEPEDSRRRDYWTTRLGCFEAYDEYLLQGDNSWIGSWDIKAFEEIHHPQIDALRLRRDEKIKEREREDQQRREEERKRREEKVRQEKEEEKRRLEYLKDVVTDKFRKGERINASDFLGLLDLYGIALHPRTLHLIRGKVQWLNKDGSISYLKYHRKESRPKFDGCWLVIDKLKNHLENIYSSAS